MKGKEVVTGWRQADTSVYYKIGFD